MNKEKIIKEIEECFDDMKKKTCEMDNIYGPELIPLFRNYTDEIIKIVREGE